MSSSPLASCKAAEETVQRRRWKKTQSWSAVPSSAPVESAAQEPDRCTNQYRVGFKAQQTRPNVKCWPKERQENRPTGGGRVPTHTTEEEPRTAPASSISTSRSKTQKGEAPGGGRQRQRKQGYMARCDAIISDAVQINKRHQAQPTVDRFDINTGLREVQTQWGSYKRS